MRCTYLAVEYIKKLSKGQGGIIINMASYAGLVKKPHINFDFRNSSVPKNLKCSSVKH